MARDFSVLFNDISSQALLLTGGTANNRDSKSEGLPVLARDQNSYSCNFIYKH